MHHHWDVPWSHMYHISHSFQPLLRWRLLQILFQSMTEILQCHFETKTRHKLKTDNLCCPKIGPGYIDSVRKYGYFSIKTIQVPEKSTKISCTFTILEKKTTGSSIGPKIFTSFLDHHKHHHQQQAIKHNKIGPIGPILMCPHV